MIASLFGCIREYRRDSCLAPFFVALEVVVDVILPYLMARIIDHGIAASDAGAIWRIGTLLIVAALLSLLFGVLAGRFAAVASSGFAGNLRRDMYRNIQTFAYADIDRFSTASLVTRLTTDVTNVQNSFQMLLRIMVRSPLMLVFSLAMAFKVNARVALVFLAVAPVLGVGLYFIITRAHPVFARVARTYDRLNTVVRENLRGIRAVKAYVREGFETEKFNAVSADILSGFTRAEMLVAMNAPLMQFSMYSCILLLSWLGARMIVAGSMSTGQFMGLVTYASQVLMSLMMLSMVLMMIAVSRASAVRIAEVLDAESSMPPAPGAVDAVADGSVSFQGATFGYGDCDHAMCLRDISLDIAAGETIGVVGGTGSGKTTLVQLIPRLYDVSEGAVLVGGVDVRRYAARALHGRVAMVPQNSLLFAGSIRDNLRWGNRDADDAALARACRLARADEFIASLADGYDHRVEQGGTNLSGGQRQRLCIARALVKDPLVLILDDSTSAIDAKNDEAIRRALREELPGVTKIIIAQRIASVMHADRILVMDAGGIDAFASHDELLAGNTIYREVYNSQMKEGDDGHGPA